MPISFNQIPATIRVPLVAIEIDNTGAIVGSALQPYKALVIGQKTSAGTVSALTPTRVTSAAQAAQYFGAGSMLHNMAEAYFASNTYTETDFVAIDDNGSHTAATGTVAFSGTPTAAGTYSLYIAGRNVQIGVSTTSTASTLATALAAAVTAATSLPVTASASTGTVTLTAKNKGVSGNAIDIRANYNTGEVTPTGLTATITAMSNGSGNPDISGVWATSVVNDQFNVMVCPYTDSAALTSLETELARRNGPLVQMEGMAFTAINGNLSAATTLSAARNSQFNSLMASNVSPSSPWEWAAETAALAGYYGNIDPARPFKTLAYSFVKPAAKAVRFTFTEREQLLETGCSTHTVDADGTVRIERLVTTYQTNPAGADDPSYLDVNTLFTLGYLRYATRNMILTKYPRHKLADDGTRYGPGQAIVTPSVMKAELVNLAREWEENGLIENADGFKAGLIVERSADDRNRLDILMTPDLVNQLQVVADQIKFVL